MKKRCLVRWIPFVVTVFYSIFACAPECHAQEKPSWTANPPMIYQAKGVYPSPVVIRLYKNSCTVDSDGKVTNGVSSQTHYTVSMTGIGVVADKPTPGSCSLTTSLTISGSAQPGSFALAINEPTSNDGLANDGLANDGLANDGFALFDLMDSTAGPIPANPQVDVLWEVLTDHLCKDNFGNHMPHDLFCIEVKIGNNSAHPLQLAGVGFFRESPKCKDKSNDPVYDCANDIRTPNVSYQTARASAQAGSTTTFRNLLFNGTQAAGLLMASFTPYFTNSFNKSRWATGAAVISSGLTQAINLVAPDQTVKEINNLDDQAFRDGKLIPNNTQVRLLVFVQKRSLAEPIGEIVPRIEAANQHPCTTPMEAGYKPVPGLSGQCYPGWEDGLTNCVKKLVCDPLIVKLALGRMVIVGDTIQFIQRVVVDPAVTSQEAQVPGTGTNAGLIGSTELSISSKDGNSQSAKVNEPFAKPLVVMVTDGKGTPKSGVVVTFNPPTTGASGTFEGGKNTATTDENGVASSSIFTANATAGSYKVTATVVGTKTAEFQLTNTR